MQQILKLAIDSSLNAIGIASIDDRLVYVNRALLRMWGYDQAEELQGRRIADFFEGDTVHETLLMLRDGHSVEGTEVGHRKDGSSLRVRFTATVLPNTGDSPTYAYVSFVDVTKQLQLQEEPQDRDARFRSLMSAIPGMVYSAGADWGVTYVSDYCETVTGYSAKEFTTQKVSWLDLIHPDDKAAILKESGSSSPSSVRLEHEYRIRNRAGKTVWVRDVKTLHFADGQPAGATGFVTDITARKRMEEQLAQADRLATVGLMAAGVAHEMNNPLSVMLGYAELVEERLNQAPSDLRKHVSGMHKPLQAITKTGRRCKRIVEELLSFGAPPQRGLESVDLAAVLHATTELVELQIRQNGVVLDLDFATEPLVSGNTHQLKLAFSNLLLNALQSMPDGGKLQVIVRTEPGDPARALAEIRDTGVGIPKAALRRIFDPFFTTKPVGEGTGLGLSIVYGIVDHHRGQVEVTSEPGQGTTVRVWLPLAED